MLCPPLLIIPYICFPVSKTHSFIRTIYKDFDGPIFYSCVNYLACSSSVNVNYDVAANTAPSVITDQWRVYAISVKRLKTSGLFRWASMFREKM